MSASGDLMNCLLSTIITSLREFAARDYETRYREIGCVFCRLSRFAMRRLAIIVSNLIALTDNKRWLLSTINLSIKHAPCPKLLDNRWFLDAARDGPREMPQSVYVLCDYYSRTIIMSLEAFKSGLHVSYFCHIFLFFLMNFKSIFLQRMTFAVE